MTESKSKHTGMYFLQLGIVCPNVSVFVTTNEAVIATKRERPRTVKMARRVDFIDFVGCVWVDMGDEVGSDVFSPSAFFRCCIELMFLGMRMQMFGNYGRKVRGISLFAKRTRVAWVSGGAKPRYNFSGVSGR